MLSQVVSVVVQKNNLPNVFISIINNMNCKKILSIAFCVACALCASAAKTPKYVFYFIGDGMGLNQVNGTETYLGALDGRIGIGELCFASFPYTALGTSYSASNGITDSAAGGTALATGCKTYNGCLGLRPDSVTTITSVAKWAKDAGMAVGVTTSVSVDHATPASFYAHQTYRGKYYEVGCDLAASGFDFFAGSDFLKPKSKDTAAPDLYTLCGEAGYTIARGYQDYQKKKRLAQRMIMLQSEDASKVDRSALPYAIDRKPGDMTLQEITSAAIDFLYAKSPKGFFLMVEGGKIDWAAHANDTRTVFSEVIDMDNAVRIAYDFMKKHPDETLIVVTADHETGGLGLGNCDYTLHTDLLKYQSMSAAEYSNHLGSLRKRLGEGFTFDAVRKDLTEHFGFWSAVPVAEDQEDQLQRAYEAIVEGSDKGAESMYAQENALGNLAKNILNANAHLGWTSGQHTNGYIPVFAVGAGAEAFHGRIENTDIAPLIGTIAGYCKGNPNDKK